MKRFTNTLYEGDIMTINIEREISTNTNSEIIIDDFKRLKDHIILF